MAKALSIRAPWWWFILHGGKDIENRKWWTGYRGTVLVHAAKGIVQRDLREDFSFCTATMKATGHAPPGIQLAPHTFLNDRYRGALVGTVEIVDCVRDSDSPWFFGPYGFVLRNPRAFQDGSTGKPIPFKGSLGFFDVPDEMVRGLA